MMRDFYNFSPQSVFLKAIIMKNSLILFFYLLTSSIFAQATMNMEALGDFDYTSDEWSDIWGYVDEEGNEYAISGTEDSIYFIDVTDCANPQVIYQYNGNSPIWRDFKVYEDYAYSVCDGSGCTEGLRIFDLSALPTGGITFAGAKTTWFTRAHNIFIDEENGRLYACDVYDSGVKRDLVILDIATDPKNPILLYEGSLGGGYLHDLNVKDNIIYGSYFYGDDFRIYDANDPNNIFLIEELSGMDGAHASWNDADEEWAYLIEEKSDHTINVIDMANLDDPNNDIEIVNQIWDPLESDNGLIAHNLFVLNDFLYMSHYEDGVKVYDITDRENPVIAGYNDIYTQNNNNYTGFEGTWGIYPFFPSGCIVASDITNGVNTMQLDWEIADTCTPVVNIESPVVGGLYSASNHLITKVETDQTSPTILQGVLSVELLPGFEATRLQDFEAKIEECVPNN